MSEEVNKKDWEIAMMNYESLIVNNKINAEIQKVALEFVKKKIAEFPAEDKEKDDMPSELKDTLKEITK